MPAIKKNDIIGVDVKKAFEDLNTAISSTLGLMEQLVTSANTLQSSLKGTNIVQLTQAQQQYNEVQKTNVKLQQEIVKLKKLSTDLEKAEAKTKAGIAKAENDLNKEKQRGIKLEEDNLRKIAQKTSLYAQESAALTKLRNETLSLALQIQKTTAAQGKESAEVKRLTAEYEKNAAAVVHMDKNLSAIEAKLGKYNRNVGNYTNANYGLNTSFNQITRELPVLGMNLNTFFLAISNNIPMFVDELDKLRIANKALREEGQAAPPVWKSITSAIFSWQTALNIGVALLVLYGKHLVDWTANLIKGTKAVDAQANAMKDMNDIMAEGAKEASRELVNARVLYDAAVNSANGKEIQIQAIKKLRDQYPAYFQDLSDEDIMLGKASDSYDKLTQNIKDNAMARAAMNVLVKKYEEYAEKGVELYKKREERLSKLGKEPVWKIDEEIEQIKESMLTLKKEGDILMNNTDFSSMFSGSSDTSVSDDIKNKADKTLQYMREYTDALIDINYEGTMKEIKQTEIKYDREINDLKDKLANEKDLTEKAVNAINGLIKVKEEQKQRDIKDIQKKASDEYLKKMIDISAIQINSKKDEAKTLAEMDKEITDEIEEELKKREELQKRYAEANREIQEQAFEFGSSLIGAMFDIRINKLEEENERIRESYDDRLENEKLSEEQKKLLEKERDKQLKANEKKARELQKKQFLIDQLIKIAQTRINTQAAAMAAMIYDPTGVLATKIRIQGALAVATIAATMIPALDKGSESTPSKYIAGEKRTEIRVDKKGNASLITKPTLFMNDKGSRIIGGAETARMLETAKNSMILSDSSRTKDENIQLLLALNGIRKDLKKHSGNSIRIMNKSDVSLIAYKTKMRNG